MSWEETSRSRRPRGTPATPGRVRRHRGHLQPADDPAPVQSAHLHLEEVDPNCEGLRYVREVEERPITRVLSNNFAFGGVEHLPAARRAQLKQAVVEREARDVVFQRDVDAVAVAARELDFGRLPVACVLADRSE